MRSGSTSSVARPRKNEVSSTGLPDVSSPPSAARNAWAMSSRPVASGTARVPDRIPTRLVHRRRPSRLRQHLLGAASAVAIAPAHVGVVLHHAAKLEDAVHE